MKKMAVKIIYFVHGTTSDNSKKICSGWKQAKLNKLGIEQAINLGKTTNYEFDELFTSDLERAIESAKLAFPKYKAIEDNRLRECNYGLLDGAPKEEVIYEEHITKAFPGGESLKDVEKRIKEFLDFLKENYEGKTVGIVAHRAPQIAIEVLTKKITWEDAIENDWRKSGNWRPGWEYEI